LRVDSSEDEAAGQQQDEYQPQQIVEATIEKE